MKSKYKVIFIDWNNTLSSSKFWGHLSSGSESEKILFNKIERSLFKKNKKILKPWMKGRKTYKQVVKTIASDIDEQPSLISHHLKISCQNMEYTHQEIPQLVNKIQKRGTRVIIATDNMDTFDKWTVPALKINKTFDRVLNSYNIGLLKNEINERRFNFFENFLKTNGISPDECVLLDNNLEDKDRIESIKINFIHIPKPTKLINMLISLI